MEYTYPLLDRIFDYYYSKRDASISDYKLYSCMHLLEPQYEMYKRFIKFGFKAESIVALGKAYSSNKGIIQELTALGIRVLQPTFSGQAFDDEHTENCSSIAQEINENTKNIILDDGGYLIDASKNKKIFFAVEQTSSGFRKLEEVAVNFPIFNVARSKTKLTQESPIIARKIFERVTEYTEDKMISSPKVVIIGLGPIGNATYQIFKAEGFNVDGFDLEKDKGNMIAYLLEKKPDLVIGATGRQLFTEKDFNALENDHPYYLMSVSSSDREFPVAAYRQNTEVHADVVYKNLTFVNNGFPITFKGLRNELTPVEIEKTIALLMGSIFEGITAYPEGNQGFLEIPITLQDLLNSNGDCGAF
ncbi:MAG: hypothetical protein KGH79_02950 [Patescibacteria group bacterium]|nr:hypothetical protein [Patescibacteria group bacterium]